MVIFSPVGTPCFCCVVVEMHAVCDVDQTAVFQRLHHLLEPRNRRELKIHNARNTVRLNGGGQGAYV